VRDVAADQPPWGAVADERALARADGGDGEQSVEVALAGTPFRTDSRRALRELPEGAGAEALRD
jgi:hypothetical protein